MADRYWVNTGAQVDWGSTTGCSGTTCWSTTSGGPPGASVPGNGDAAIFDGNGTGDCRVLFAVSVLTSLSLVSGYTGTLRNLAALVTESFACASGATFTADAFVTIRGNFTNNGTINGASEIVPQWLSNSSYSLSGSGTFGCALRFSSATSDAVLNIGSDIDITSDVTMQASVSGRALTVSNTGNYNISVGGDIATDKGTGGTVTWTKGTGTITLSGSADQDIDFDGESVEDIVIDKTAGTVTLTGGVVTDSLTLTSGTLDCGSQTLETVGNFTMAAGTTVTET